MKSKPSNVPLQDMPDDKEMEELYRSQLEDAPSVSLLNEAGHEVPDPISAIAEVDFQDPQTFHEMLQSFFEGAEMRQKLREQGNETFAEADDFEVGEDYEPSSPYEGDFDTPLADLAKAMQETLYGVQNGEKPPAATAPAPAPSAPPAPLPAQSEGLPSEQK